ncbi:SCAN domain-containing protein 3 [Trichonephila clavipes]|nr:SCAN domain-containing protein 3 [Trichonephila clavipes]
MVLGKDDKDVKTMPLSNSTVSRIGGISSLRDSETVLVTYVRCVKKGDFAEEMFCKSLEITTTSKDVYNKLEAYLGVNNIPMKNITSCAADGTSNMMGKKNGCLKWTKDENPNMLLVQCVIHKENLWPRYGYRIVACFVTSSIPVPLKTRRVGQRCTLNLSRAETSSHWTATAGSDVVQSGRPIFDDFFQHLWPYIGNNTANVVFQMVKRLWLIRIDQ